MDQNLKEQLDRASADDRYEGKRFLRLLEMYVLDSIGQIENHALEALSEMEPSLQTTFGVAGDWKKIVEQIMEFSPEIQPHIRELWVRNQEIAENAGHGLTPDLFARMFVDANFDIDGDVNA